MTALALQECGVYTITHKESGKRYVGSALQMGKRFAEHKERLRKGKHHNILLQRAWQLYGAEAFEFKALLVCDKENKLFYEQRAIDGFKVTDTKFGYNICPSAWDRVGAKHSPESREKIKIGIAKAKAEGRIGGWKGPRPASFNEQVKLGVKKARSLGKIIGNHKPHSEEAKMKMRESSKGQIPWNKDIPMSAEVKNKISIAAKLAASLPEAMLIRQSAYVLFCKHGHEMSGDNLYITPKKKSRGCRQCAKRRSREFKFRKKLARAA